MMRKIKNTVATTQDAKLVRPDGGSSPGMCGLPMAVLTAELERDLNLEERRENSGVFGHKIK